MTKVTICMVGALVIAIITLVLLAQRLGESSQLLQQAQQDRDLLREEVETLRQDLVPSETTVVPHVPLQIDAADIERLQQAERDLLRVRNEVTQLREELKKVAPDASEGMVLKGKERFVTPESYQPPVAITVVAKTDSTNLRLAYAADQVIFNWEVDASQLRVDGGPASGQHQDGAGSIPVGEYVTVQWIVTRTNQEILVNGERRLHHEGDYSQINYPVSVFPAHGSTVTISGFEVKQLDAVMR